MQVHEERLNALNRDLAQCEVRLTRLTDAFLDALDRQGDLRDPQKSASHRAAVVNEMHWKSPQTEPFGERVLKNLERGRTAYLGYDLAIPDGKTGEIVRELTSNLVARGKSLDITMRPEFQAFLDWRISQ